MCTRKCIQSDVFFFFYAIVTTTGVRPARNVWSRRGRESVRTKTADFDVVEGGNPHCSSKFSVPSGTKGDGVGGLGLTWEGGKNVVLFRTRVGIVGELFTRSCIQRVAVRRLRFNPLQGGE